MNRRELLLKLFPAVIAAAAAPTYFLPPRGGWQPWANGVIGRYDGFTWLDEAKCAQLAGSVTVLTLEHIRHAKEILSREQPEEPIVYSQAWIDAFRRAVPMLESGMYRRRRA